ncbi:hypothetical protein DRO55_04055 [Candidatus Bathyarchaeota archaeon]|nr:MAG: hypothetical protein DRO55_04055 [Candidatus Bathyarchaeota archaeon]
MGDAPLKVSKIPIVRVRRVLLIALILTAGSILMASVSTISYHDQISSGWIDVQVGGGGVTFRMEPPEGWYTARMWSAENPPRGVIELYATDGVRLNYSYQAESGVLEVSGDGNLTLELKGVETVVGNAVSITGEPCILRYNYRVMGVIKPFMWLSIPSAILMFMAIILTIKGLLRSLSSIRREHDHSTYQDSYNQHAT